MVSLAAGFLSAAVARADILISFPPGTDTGQVARVADSVGRTCGVSARGATRMESLVPVVESATPKSAAETLARARRAYRDLDLDEAVELLAGAQKECLETAEFVRCRELLFDVNLLRGIIESTRGEMESAKVFFRTAHSFMPEKVIDPRQHPPRIVADFNRACTTGGAGRKVEARTEPPGGSIAVNGVLLDQGPLVPFDTGLVVVEAKMLGYEPAKMLVKPGPESPLDEELVVRLKPLPEDQAWMELRRGLQRADGLDDPGMVRLLARFGLDRVVILERGKEIGVAFEAALARPGGGPTVALGKMRSEDEMEKELGPLLAKALGVAVTQDRPPREIVPLVLEPDPDDVGDDREDDLVRFPDGDDEDDGEPGEAGKVFRSPWFWVGVGVVVAVVGGVIIGTQAGD